MIEKMKFVSVIGRKEQLDTVTGKYLSRYEIQLENAVGVLKNLNNLTPGVEVNPYREPAAKAAEIAAHYGSDASGLTRMDAEKAADLAAWAQEKVQESAKKTDGLQNELKKKMELLAGIAPYQELHFDISRILHFKEVRFRFGRLPVAYYERLKTYAYDDMCTIFEKCRQDENYVWGIYFVPAAEAKKVDAIYSSLHFERIFVEDAYEGTVDEACERLRKEIRELEEAVAGEETVLKNELTSKGAELSCAAESLSYAAKLFDVRKLAAFTKAKNETFFILCGWMVGNEANSLKKELENDPSIFCTLEENPDRRVMVPRPA